MSRHEIPASRVEPKGANGSFPFAFGIDVIFILHISYVRPRVALKADRAVTFCHGTKRGSEALYAR